MALGLLAGSFFYIFFLFLLPCFFFFFFFSRAGQLGSRIKQDGFYVDLSGHKKSNSGASVSAGKNLNTSGGVCKLGYHTKLKLSN